MNEKSKSGLTAAKSKKQFAVLAAVFCFVAVIAIILTARNSTGGQNSLPESRDIFTLQDHYNMTVVVVFDEEPPTVQFIAPDGIRVDMETIRYRHGSNFVQYFLPDAMPGVWRMDYDPLTNTEISTPYSVYMEKIFIRNFEIEAARDEQGGRPVTFEVSADNSGEFVYEIHAIFTAPDNSIEDEILLARGYGLLNEKLALSLDTTEIRDMGGFMLRLTAYVRHGQASIRDSAWLDLRLTPMP